MTPMQPDEPYEAPPLQWYRANVTIWMNLPPEVNPFTILQSIVPPEGVTNFQVESVTPEQRQGAIL